MCICVHVCVCEVLLEAVRREEVEQVKQLLQVVLERSSCQQQLVVDLIVIQTPEKLETKRGKRLNSLSYI